MATPPAGTTLCGQGQLGASDIVDGCNASPTSSGASVSTRMCDALTTTGGRWEAWCTTAGIAYLWLGLSGAKVQSGCAADLTGFGQEELFGPSSSQGGTLVGGTQSATLMSWPEDVAVDMTVQAGWTSGTGHVWLVGDLMCGMSDSGPVTLAGFGFSWKL